MNTTAYRWLTVTVLCIALGVRGVWGQSETENDDPYEILVLRGEYAEDFSFISSMEFVWFNYAAGYDRPFFQYIPPDGFTTGAYEVIDERYLFIVEAISESAGWGRLGQYRIARIDMVSGQRDELYQQTNLTYMDVSEQGNYGRIGYWPADLTYVERGQQGGHVCIVDWATQVCTELTQIEVLNGNSFWWNEELAYISYPDEQGQRFVVRYNPATFEETSISLPEAIGNIVDTYVAPISHQLFLIEGSGEQSDICHLWRSTEAQDALESVGQVVCGNFEDISNEKESAVLTNTTRDTMTVVSLLTGQTTDVIPVPFNTNSLGYNRPNWHSVELIDISPATQFTLLIANLASNNGFGLVRAFYALDPTRVAGNFQRVYPFFGDIDWVVPAD